MQLQTRARCLMSGQRLGGARRAGCVRSKALQWSMGGFPDLSKLFQPRQQEPTRPEVVDTILELASNGDRGLQSSPREQAEIRRLVDQLEEEMQGVETTADPKLLSATWRLLWTTEKETQFIVKNAGVFGTEAGDIFQVIDLGTGSLQNVITFPPSGAFVVNSKIAVGGPKRIVFKFTSAELQRSDRAFNIPPFGEGWFDTIYVDDEVRIAKDIRKDVLVVVRDGPPRKF